MVAAGHPLTAEAGARVLREGGNAVDAAVAAMLTSFVTRAAADRPRRRRVHARRGRRAGAARCSTSSSQAPSRERRRQRGRARRHRRVLRRRRAGVPHRAGLLRGLRHAGGRVRGGARWGTVALAELAAPAARARARRGRAQRRRRPTSPRSSTELLSSTPEAPRCGRPRGRILREGEHAAQPASSATRSSGSARDGARAVLPRRASPSTVSTGSASAAGSVTPSRPRRLPSDRARPGADGLPRPRDPHQPAALGRRHAARLRAGAARPRARRRPRCAAIVAAMAAAQAERTPEFVDGPRPSDGFLERFLAQRLGSTTHISVIDARRAARAASPAPTARAPAWSCRAPASTSTT